LAIKLIQQQFCPKLSQTLTAISPNLGTYIQSAPTWAHTSNQPQCQVKKKIIPKFIPNPSQIIQLTPKNIEMYPQNKKSTTYLHFPVEVSTAAMRTTFIRSKAGHVLGRKPLFDWGSRNSRAREMASVELPL